LRACIQRDAGGARRAVFIRHRCGLDLDPVDLIALPLHRKQ